MNWRERLALLFGVGAAASLLGLPEEAFAAASPALTTEGAPEQSVLVFSSPSENAALLQLAQHRSHSSHSSHRSHSSHQSHYSGSGGGYTAPRYTPPAPPYVPPPPAPVPYVGTDAIRPVTPGSTETRRLTQPEILDFVQRVQIALIMKGYDPGPTDGHLGPRTQTALRAYQSANGLPVTGYLDVETVQRIGVSPQ